MKKPLITEILSFGTKTHNWTILHSSMVDDQILDIFPEVLELEIWGI